MTSPYVADIIFFDTLFDRTPFIQQLWDDLKPIYEKCKTNTDSCMIFDEIFNQLQKTVQSVPYIDNSFFLSHIQQFKYELIWDVFSKSYIYTKNTLKPNEYAKSYIQITNETESTINKYRTDNKSLMILDLSKRLSYIDYVNKIHVYHDYVVRPIINNNIFCYSSFKEDIIFHWIHYKKFLFTSEKRNRGIDIIALNELINEYLAYTNQISQKTSFALEHSAYIFNLFYSLIQYLDCFKSYLSREFSKVAIPNEYLPLYEYTKLYDTNYLSLTRYITDKYKTTIENIYTADKNSRRDMFREMQLMNIFILPIINLAIKRFLFNLFDGNLEQITAAAKAYITALMDSDSEGIHTYRSLLTSASESLKSLKYPSDGKSSNSKPRSRKILNKDSLKHDRIEYKFNKALSYCFYKRDIGNDYLSNCSMGTCFCNIDNCALSLDETYEFKWNNPFHQSINACTESLEYMLDKIFGETESENTANSKKDEQRKRDEKKRISDAVMSEKRKIVKSMLNKGLSIHEIAEYTELNEDEITKIQNNPDWNEPEN